MPDFFKSGGLFNMYRHAQTKPWEGDHTGSKLLLLEKKKKTLAILQLLTSLAPITDDSWSMWHGSLLCVVPCARGSVDAGLCNLALVKHVCAGTSLGQGGNEPLVEYTMISR